MSKKRDKLTIKEIAISEEIQSKLAPIITEYLDNKGAIMDALNWILMVITNDENNDLEIYQTTWKREIDKKIDIDEDTMTINDLDYYMIPETEFEEYLLDGYVCQPCATKMGAVALPDICTWHTSKCDFCGEVTSLCHTSDWKWCRFPKPHQEF